MFEMEIDGGVPVYRPNYEEFRDFKTFVEQIEPMGMQTGIVKVIPPPEWLATLPQINKAATDRIQIKRPIIQNAIGSRGMYGVQNVEKQRNYTLESWRKVCAEPTNQPPPKRGVKREKEELPEDVTEFDDSKFTQERCSDFERMYWASLGYSAPMYGADMPGSLFDDGVSDWNVAHLDNILNNLDAQIPGVNTAYLYCGMWKATFAWHTEDMDLHSINYIHFGAPKQWYSIPQEHKDKFYKLMAAIFPDDSKSCPEFLRHKTFMVSPSVLEEHGIKVNHIVHRQHEFMITFPHGYHAGFNYGYNCAESVNFATDMWLDIGKSSGVCQCVSHSVGIDVNQLIRRINGEPLSPPDSPDDHGQLALAAAAEPRKKTAKKRKGGRESAPAPPPKRKAPPTPPPKRFLCALCPSNRDNLLPNATKTARAHRICAQLIPEVGILDETVVGLDDVHIERFRLRCTVCRVGHGACFQCAYPRCTRAFHPTCAARAGVVTENSLHMCRFHRNAPPKLPANANEALAVAQERCHGLLAGDVVQCLIGSSQYVAGIVQANELSESMLIISLLPDCTQTLEVPYLSVVPGKLDPSVGSELATKNRHTIAAEIARQAREAEAAAAEKKKREEQEHQERLAREAAAAVRPELYAVNKGNGVESPFLFMGIPLPSCLQRTTPL